MTDEQLLKRIVVNREVLAGKPIVRGTRLSVEYVVNLLAHGSAVSDIVGEYEGLTEDDVRACLLYAARSLEASAVVSIGKPS